MPPEDKEKSGGTETTETTYEMGVFFRRVGTNSTTPPGEYPGPPGAARAGSRDTEDERRDPIT